MLLSLSKRLTNILRKVPKGVTRGIQLALAVTLAIAGGEMMQPEILIAIPLIIAGFLLLKNKFLPAAIFLILFGFVYAVMTGALSLSEITLGFSLPEHPVFYR